MTSGFLELTTDAFVKIILFCFGGFFLVKCLVVFCQNETMQSSMVMQILAYIYGKANFRIFWLLYQDSSVLLFLGLTKSGKLRIV